MEMRSLSWSCLGAFVKSVRRHCHLSLVSSAWRHRGIDIALAPRRGVRISGYPVPQSQLRCFGAGADLQQMLFSMADTT